MPGAVGNISAWYERATLFVLPSRFEGFPNVLLEAMAAGCVCIASDCLTGPADLIDDGLNGLLLAEQASTTDWVDGLGGLLSDPSQRQSLAEQACRVRQRFSEERLRRDFLDALHQPRHG